MSAMRTRASVRLGVAAGLAAVFLSASHAESPAPSHLHSIVISQLAFGKAPEVIHVGDAVEWENKDIFVHSATADDKSFDVDMQPNRTARVVMRKAGTIHYICKYHPGMTGDLVVTPAR